MLALALAHLFKRAALLAAALALPHPAGTTAAATTATAATTTTATATATAATATAATATAAATATTAAATAAAAAAAAAAPRGCAAVPALLLAPMDKSVDPASTALECYDAPVLGRLV